MLTFKTATREYNDCYLELIALSENPSLERLRVMSKSAGVVAIANYVDTTIDYPNEIAIKDYSENKGVYDLLVELGIIDKSSHYKTIGLAELLICKFHRDRVAQFSK